jgi:hypothetical protein
MVLSSTDTLRVQGTLAVVLWIEAVVYLLVGLTEIFDDFRSAPKWNEFLAAKKNSWLRTQLKIGAKMHASVAVILGLTAVNGLIEGAVTRFELEVIFVSLGLLMGVILGSMVPGRMWVIVCLIKPETWLTLLMWCNFASAVRPAVLGISFTFVAWSLLVRFGPKSVATPDPFEYRTLRTDILASFPPELGTAMTAKMDGVAGYAPTKEDGRPESML